MRFISTRGAGSFDLAEALRLGPAPDGGLLVPERLEPVSPEVWRSLGDRSLHEIADLVLGRLLGGALAPDALAPIVREALDFPIPLRRLDPRRALLELFHGPTLAFKDVGARFLARLLAVTAPAGETTTVLVATSGDTGGAVAHAFFGVAGVRVVVLYPRGQVSPLQERQMATLGGNVHAFAVEGTFDDCQRLAKQAFAERPLARRHGLTSANSINLGRLLPQAIYYAHAAAQLAREAPSARPVFVVPSGNFGNLTAGLMARQLGLTARFVAATNVNDAVPAYLDTGRYEPRDSVRTLSNAMDVGAPSNLERIRWLFDDDLDALRSVVCGERVDDAQTRAAIRETFARHRVVLDPHTAVGVTALERQLARCAADEVGVVLATAHAAKFHREVDPLLDRPVEIPARLARHRQAELRARRLEPTLGALADALA